MLNPPIPNILLVMDDDGDASHAVHILAKYHFSNSLLRLHRSQEALRYFTQVNAGAEAPPNGLPELIILSLDGAAMEVVQATRKKWFADVPLVIVAASREEEETVRQLNLPKTYCFGKPLGFFKLLEAMQKLGMYWIVLRSPPSRP